jgi:hypothetical protein
MNTYDKGDKVRVTGRFANGTVDPTTLTAKISNPSGTVTTYVYGADAQLVRESLGVFYVDVSLTAPGTWLVAFVGTGVAEAAELHELYVRVSQFAY